ncbi:MAG: SDR family oxidoreductase [Rhizobiaceae bacterium]|nr:SDR family oxidoreductase [Rhizobiaceae bacterium]
MARHSGKVAIVTGGANGIGLATAQRLSDEGASVALLDLAEPAEAPPSSLRLRCDVGDEGDVRDAIDRVATHFGRIDIAVLSAGIESNISTLETTEVTIFDRVMGVNARGVFLCIKHAIPHMRSGGGGSIVALASTGGLRGSRGLGAYAASKHAVVGLVKTAALELATDAIRVNAVCPSPVETRMMRAIEAGFDPTDPGSAQARIAGGVPLGRYARPDEIAGLIAYLASDEAAYLTGGCYLADGGVMAG